MKAFYLFLALILIVGYAPPDFSAHPQLDPINLEAEPLSYSSIQLNWNDIDNEDAYKIFWEKANEDQQSWALSSLVDPDITTFTVTGLQSNTLYDFYVVAFNGTEENASNVASGRTHRYYAIPPRIAWFSINNAWFPPNDSRDNTTSKNVTLNNSCLYQPTHYRASENTNLDDAEWKPYSTSPDFILSEGNGLKKVYFQVKNIAGVSQIVDDTICDITNYRGDPRTLCETPEPIIDPGIVGHSLYLGHAYDNYKLDIHYRIFVNEVPDADDLVIILKAEYPTVTKEINYGAGRSVGGYRRHRGTLTIEREVLTQPNIFEPFKPDHRPMNITIRVKYRTYRGGRDDDPANNTVTREIRWGKKTITSEHSIDDCMGPTGGSGDWKFDLSSRTTDHAWIGSSYFFFGNLQFSNNTELMTEDVNPAPFWGGRGVQWKKHPSTDDKKGKIHWWCEGYANEMGREGIEIGLSDGRTIRTDAGPVYRIFMTCFAYEPYFVDN